MKYKTKTWLYVGLGIVAVALAVVAQLLGM